MKTSLGKGWGAVGALLLFSSPFTLLLSTGSGVFAGVKALLGGVLLGAFLITEAFNRRSRGQNPGLGFSFSKGMAPRGTLTLLGVLLGLLLLNVLAHKKNVTLDVTSKRIFSLSPQTKSTLDALKEPVSAIAFFPATHPNYDEVESILKQYAASSTRFQYEFQDPRKNPGLATRYQVKVGETPILLVQDGRQVSLDVVGEHELTNALLKLNSFREHALYFLEGHGEWSLQSKEFSSLGASLRQEGYSLHPLSLLERASVPDDASAVVIAGAKSPLTEKEKALLASFLEEGGRLLYFTDAFLEPGLDDLLEDYGIQVDNGLSADAEVNPRNPYEMVTGVFSEHPMTRLLKQLQFHVVLPTCRALSVLRQGSLANVTTEPIALTFPSAWVESEPDGLPRLTDGEKAGVLPLVVASTRPAAGTQRKRFDEARLVVFGDSDLLTDSYFGFEGNRNLVLNAFAWASAQVEQMTIRAPDRERSTLLLDETRLMSLRFLALDALPLTFLAIGVSLYLKRRNR